MIDLKNIETFICVAELGGFRLAAQRLHVTQSAISQRIATLEDTLGVKLLERTTTSVAANAKGRALIPIAEEMLRLRSEMFKVVDSANTFRGHIRVGVAETIAHTKLILLVEKMRATYPFITLDIEVDLSKNLRDDLLSGNLDIIFVTGTVIEPDVRNVEYVRYSMAWVASPALKLHGKTTSLRDIARYPIITYSKKTKPHVDIRNILANASIKDYKIYGNTSLAAIITLCTKGIGVGVLPPAVIAQELANKELVYIDVAGGEIPDLPFTICYMLSADAYLLEAIANLALEL